jgi:hypothetical protein
MLKLPKKTLKKINLIFLKIKNTFKNIKKKKRSCAKHS